MTDQELETTLQTALTPRNTPSRESFTVMLSELPTSPVTKQTEIRYTTQTATSNIINNILVQIVSIWKSNKVLLLVPTCLVFLLVGAFSLSPRITAYTQNRALLQLAEQDASIEALGDDTDDQVILASFDESDSSTLDIQPNEFQF